MLVHDRDARIPDAATVTQRLLEAFPTVLPDGTEKATAVIVPQAAAAVDTAGDTEVFTAAAFAAVGTRRFLFELAPVKPVVVPVPTTTPLIGGGQGLS